MRKEKLLPRPPTSPKGDFEDTDGSKSILFMRHCNLILLANTSRLNFDKILFLPE